MKNTEKSASVYYLLQYWTIIALYFSQKEEFYCCITINHAVFRWKGNPSERESYHLLELQINKNSCHTFNLVKNKYSNIPLQWKSRKKVDPNCRIVQVVNFSYSQPFLQ